MKSHFGRFLFPASVCHTFQERIFTKYVFAFQGLGADPGGSAGGAQPLKYTFVPLFSKMTTFFLLF